MCLIDGWTTSCKEKSKGQIGVLAKSHSSRGKLKEMVSKEYQVPVCHKSKDVKCHMTSRVFH